MLFDDYEWPARSGVCPHNPPSKNHPNHPKRGIDAFLSVAREECEVLHQGYQVLVRKTAPQSFGFPRAGGVIAPTSLIESEEEEAVAVASAQDAGALAVLLPLTSRGVASPVEQLHLLASCLPPSPECVLFIGVDANDPVYAVASSDFWAEAFPEHFPAGHVVIEYFSPTTPPICAMPRSRWASRQRAATSSRSSATTSLSLLGGPGSNPSASPSASCANTSGRPGLAFPLDSASCV